MTEKNKNLVLTEEPIVLVDMDDTIGEFSQVYWDVHHLVFRHKVNHMLVDSWNLSQFSNRGKDAYKLFKYPGLFRNLPVKPFAQEFMTNIQKISDVFVVSDSPEGTSYQELYHIDDTEHHPIAFPHSNPADDKRMWLKENFPDFPQSNIIFCSCKWMIEGDVLVDDKPETFEIFTRKGKDVILIDMPYNRHIDTKWRAKDLKQAEEMVFDILKRKGKIK